LPLYQHQCRMIGNEGIIVNVVAPGLTLTPAVAQSMPPEMIEAQVKARAIQRDGRGEDLVGTVFFLASPDTDFMSGQTLKCRRRQTHALNEQ
jgi:NAD(P)-dependent dehydrogenase (short-subunit alcohol dehydrogenase family)